MRTAGDLDIGKTSLPWALLSLNRILKGRYVCIGLFMPEYIP